VLAQAASTTVVPPAAPASADKDTVNNQGVRQQIVGNLKQSGFTDVKVVPDSFLVQAKDKSGNPMTMFIGPNSITEVSEMNDSGSATMPAGSGGMFANVPASDDLSSKVVGLDVYNKANQDIGTIKDVAFNRNGLQGYIVGVGGFLGMGDHYVAIRPSALNISYNANDKTWHALIDTNADQLKSAPEYKYPNNS
jgi:PRC-barrel domain